jgi:colanic acid/amylovoran biosynthesis protein
VLNLGDAGIVLAQIQFLKKHVPGCRISLTSRTPALDRKLYGPLGIKVLPPLIPAPSIYAGCVQKIRQSLKNLFSFFSKWELFRVMKRADLVVSSGGGYFYSNRKVFPGPMFFQNCLPVLFAQRLNKPVIFFPQSFGPVFNTAASRILKRMLEKENVIKIFVREKASWDYLQALLKRQKCQGKIEICPDMAFYLKSESGRGERRKELNLLRPVVALTLRRWDFPEVKRVGERRKKQEEYLAALEEFCQRVFRARGGSVLIIPQVRGPGNFEDDRIISLQFWERARKLLPDKNIAYLHLLDSVSPAHIVEVFSRVDLVLATRLHSAIFAFLAGTPAITLGYQPKSKGIMELLEFEQFCAPMAGLNPDKIWEMSEEIFRQYQEIQKKIRERATQIQKFIEETLDRSLRSLFEGLKS